MSIDVGSLGSSRRLYRRLSGRSTSIRTRMTVLFVAFAIVPLIFAGTILYQLASRYTRERSVETLNLVANIREGQIKSWVEDLQLNLQAELDRDTESRRLSTLVRVEKDSSIFTAVYEEQLQIFNTSISSRAIFDELLVLDQNGEVILSTQTSQEGRLLASQDYFKQGMKGAYLRPPYFDLNLNQLAIVVAQPILSAQDESIGVLAGRASMKNLNTFIFERTGLGDTGETYLISDGQALLTDLLKPEYPVWLARIRTTATDQAVANKNSACANNCLPYLNYSSVSVLGVYRWLPDLRVALIVEQSETETFATLRGIITTMLVSTVIAIAFAVLAALLASAGLTQPLTKLTQSAQRIAAGDLDAKIPIVSLMSGLRGSARMESRSGDEDSEGETGVFVGSDEIGSLARAFAAMTGQLRALIGSLEDRVAERTAQLQARSDQLLAAAEVSRSVTVILETDRLIQRVVELIQEHFGAYYVGLYLVDDAREWAVLKAGTGRAGQAMIERGHHIRLGSGMIGWCIVNSQARVALEAAEDAVRLATADLPDTRSEAAIPLRSRGQVLGAVTIQSAEPDAFDRETIAVFQTMADQVAVAIDNARLFSQSQRAIETVQQAYGQMSRQVWLGRLQASSPGFRRNSLGLSKIEHNQPGVVPVLSSASDGPDGVGSKDRVVIPIKTRGHTIGYLNAQKRKHGEMGAATDAEVAWQSQEVGLLETLVDQLGVTLDSARLFEETQQQAERERLVGEITSHMRATLDIETVLQTAARELLHVIDLAEVEVRMVSSTVSPEVATGGPTRRSVPQTGSLRKKAPAANPLKEDSEHADERS